MISDKETNIVYFSDLLKTKSEFVSTCKSIEYILDKYKIEYIFLKGTKDIWARDYMPIQIEKDHFVQFRYEPTYLKEHLELQSDTNVVCKLNNQTPVFSMINLDGGNVVKWTDKVLISDRIYSENPEWTDTEQLVKEIKKLLKTKVVIIPQIKSDFTGHADGLVKFIDSNTILGNDLDFECKYWSKGMKEVLAVNNFEYVNMPLFEYKEKDFPDSAIGCYMNYLEIGDLIIFPIFEVSGNKDKKAVELMQKTFPDKLIETININKVAREGGLMNCISWNIKT